MEWEGGQRQYKKKEKKLAQNGRHLSSKAGTGTSN
jgi:hypothetical protein